MLEVFEGLYIAPEAIDAGLWLQGLSFFTSGARGPAMDIPEGPPFGGLSLAQSESEGGLDPAPPATAAASPMAGR